MSFTQGKCAAPGFIADLALRPIFANIGMLIRGVDSRRSVTSDRAERLDLPRSETN
jgi:hypothetical protein